MYIAVTALRGLLKLKKRKIREKLGLVRPHPLTPSSNFFLETSTTTKNTKNTKFQKKVSEFGLDPPIHFHVFLGFFDFFNLTKPPNRVVHAELLEQIE